MSVDIRKAREYLEHRLQNLPPGCTKEALLELYAVLGMLRDEPEVQPEAPKWMGGATVECTRSHCRRCKSVHLLGEPRVLNGMFKDGRWLTTDLTPVCPDCARVVAPPPDSCATCASIADNTSTCTSFSTTGARDWQKEPEVGDGAQAADCGSGIFEVAAIDRHTGRRWLRNAGRECRSSCALERMAVAAKRPDKPGDGFEIIGREHQGIHRWEGHGSEAGRWITGPLEWIPRSKLRRVYARTGKT